MLCKRPNTKWTMKALLLAAGTLAPVLVLGLEATNNGPAELPLPRGAAAAEPPAQANAFHFKRVPARPRTIPELVHHVYQGPTVAVTSLALDLVKKGSRRPSGPEMLFSGPKLSDCARRKHLLKSSKMSSVS